MNPIVDPYAYGEFDPEGVPERASSCTSPSRCSAADAGGRVPCPDCGKLVRVTNRIDSRYVCIDCWERIYQAKHGMTPNSVLCATGRSNKEAR